ncbi:uncharacterized protein LOC129701339 isoform X2 [Leucoraja erinacea]|uniref:uncharacterized protein LOC129701339 isoform X2 n=1 Tax=Leucoraja erinaceus TaxID=7782 RepID=UPI002456464B|nr:uncharacterized protein LOC129701339 isoform X2 [Leucoraja erinacea]
MENMEPKAFHRDLFGVGKRCRHHRPMSSSPTSWSSPRFPLNKILDTDSGILSNASSFETYDVGKEIFSPVDMEDVSRANRYDRHGERKLTLTLLQSETRRCALTESLQTAWCALKEQRERISKKNMEVVNHGAVIDSMILKQKLLEAKVGLLHKEEETMHEVRLDEAQRDSELQNRICILEEEVERFNHRLGQLALNRRGPQSMSTVSWYLRQENEEAEKQSQIPLQTSSDSFEYHEEHWNIKEPESQPQNQLETISDSLERHEECWNVEEEDDLHELASRLDGAETERASLEHQVSDLHTQLFQTKCESYGLKKQCLVSNSQLTANRSINESLLLETAGLKQSLQALEKQILNLQSEKTILSSQMKTLESEHQQIFNEKELLMETMESMKCHKCSDFLSPNEADGRVPSKDCEEIRSKSCPQCKFHPRIPERAKKKELFVCWEQEEGGKEDLSAVADTDKVTTTELQKTDIETEQQQETVTMLRLDPQENGKAQKESRYSEEGLQLPNGDLIKTQCNINLQFEKLLEKIEGLVKLNLKLENERDQVLCQLGMQTAEAKGLELSSEQNRKQLLHLLRKNIDLRHENQIKVNQLTALIIELHHLRRAYQTISQSTDCPQDILSADWINRVRLIKNSIQKIKTQQLNLNLLKKENEELMEKLEWESLQNMDAKLLALNENVQAKIETPMFTIKLGQKRTNQVEFEAAHFSDELAVATALEPGAMHRGTAGNCDPLATLKADQIQLLEDNFARRRQPDASSLMLISAECGLTEEATALWFKQRNAKWRQSEGFPPESTSVKD